MPQISALVVKKADNTTNVTYDAQVASSGDSSPSIHYLTAAGSAPAFRPSLTVTTKWNGNRTARIITEVYKYPVWAIGSDGVTRIIDTYIKEVKTTRPTTMADGSVLEAQAQYCHLGDMTLIRDVHVQGFAPT